MGSDLERVALTLFRPSRPVTRLLGAVTTPADLWPFLRGVVSITFDDDLGDAHDTAPPMMDAYGWGCMGYVLIPSVGVRLTLEQMHRMENAHGWKIAGYGFSRQVDLTALSAAEIDAELGGIRRWLVDNGFKGYERFAYPYS